MKAFLCKLYLFLSIFVIWSVQILTVPVMAETGASPLQSMGRRFPEPAADSKQRAEEGPLPPAPEKLYAQSAVLMDADTGRVLYGKEADLVRPMASTTKIMTCILALEKGDPEAEVTVSAYAAGQPKVHLGAPAGRKFYLRDLLYSLMLESHNDTAVMIAEHVGGSVGQFADLMNQKARELGCENTWFITPNGLDAEETLEDGTVKFHGTTARDLADIMGYCVWFSPRRKEFCEITRTQNHYFTDIEGKESYSLVNHNAFLTMMEGVMSGKTGFTGKAGYSYVAALEDVDGEKHFSLALLGCGWPPHKTYKWSDARTLFSYGSRYYEKREVFQELPLEPVVVENGIPQKGGLGCGAAVELTMNLKEEEKTLKVLMCDGEKVKIRLEVPRCLKAPVKRGTVVGKVDYILAGCQVGSFPLYTTDNVEEISLGWCVGQVLERFFGCGPLAGFV